MDENVLRYDGAVNGSAAAAVSLAPRDGDGTVEVITRKIIRGWAWYPSAPDAPVEIDVLIDDRVVATGTADMFREDLKQAGKGNGKHAFIVKFAEPLESFDPLPSVRIRGSARVLHTLPDAVTEIETVEVDDADVALAERLFHADHYARQAGIEELLNEPPLDHYLRTGHKTRFDPHPLFDSEFYRSHSPDIENYGENPLLHYIGKGYKDETRFHRLFDEKHYRNQAGESLEEFDGPALLHYLEIGQHENWSPTPFFDLRFYRETNPDVDFTGTDPLSHYLTEGYRQHRDPHPFFDSRYYAKKAGLREPLKQNPLLHLLASPLEKRLCPNSFFDKDFYLSHAEDLRRHNVCPILHFFTYGLLERHRPVGRILSDLYVLRSHPQRSLRTGHPVAHYFGLRRSKPTRLLFVSHEASRTGAPAIILNIVKWFSTFPNVDCFVIVRGDGPLVAEFRKYAHVLVTHQWGNENTPIPAHCDIAYLMDRLADNPPVAAYVNSLESRYYGRRLEELGVPVFTLAHEMPEFYQPSTIRRVAAMSRALIAPSTGIGETLRRLVPAEAEKVFVRPQGLLNPRFGSLSRATARAQIEAELGIDPGASIVLGCGTLDGRKGVDWFVAAAIAMLQQTSEPVYWLWLGDGGASDYYSVRHWAEFEVKKARLQDRIRFLGARKNVEAYFVGADVFAMTSRVDPFPCVVHEAMAAGLPTVCFERSGGAAEQLGDTGVVLPYGDTAAMARTVESLLKDERKRAALGTAARQRVRDVFVFKDYCERLAELVRADLELPADWLKPAPRAQAGSRGRILFTFDDWQISGVNSMTETLIRGLNERGFDAQVVFTLGWCTGPAVEDHLPTVPYRFLQPADHHLETIWETAEEFVVDSAPCVVVPQYEYRFSAIAPRLPATVGILGVGHSDDVEHYEHLYRLGPYWNHVVAVSQRIGEEITALHPGLGANMTVIPYGIPTSPQFTVKDHPVSVERPLRIAYLGRFVVQQKRIYDYAMLAEQLEAAGLPFKLRLIGDGEEFDEMQSRLGHLVDSGHVEMPGRLNAEEVRSVLEDTDVILVLSDFEGLPLALLEAMERGCIPLVYAIRSGIPDIIVDGQNGAIVPRGNVREAARRLIELAADPTLRHKLSLAARQTIYYRGLTADDMVDAYAAVFDRIIADITAPDAKPRRSLSNAPGLRGVALPPFLYPSSLSLDKPKG